MAKKKTDESDDSTGGIQPVTGQTEAPSAFGIFGRVMERRQSLNPMTSDKDGNEIPGVPLHEQGISAADFALVVKSLVDKKLSGARDNAVVREALYDIAAHVLAAIESIERE